MITKKKMIIPIFDYRLTVIIFDDWSEVEYIFEGPEPKAVTKFGHGCAVVAVNSKRGNSIVHEAEHVKNLIWEFIGYTPLRDNDEVDAYLLTYIYEKITNVFYKHKAAK